MRRSYPERRPVDWPHPLTGCSRHHAHAQHRPSTQTTYPHAPGTITISSERRPRSPFSALQGRRRTPPPHGTPYHTAHTPHVTHASYPSPGTHPARTRHALDTHPARTWPPLAHTKRARTNRSGRATYSAQALGRLPWFAPCLRRSRRLRPRFDMSFSLGLLSRLKHFCTHWPKPPRHRPFAATKVTEKRAAAQALSAHVTPRGRALSQRA